MAGKKAHTPKEIVAKLRQAKVLVALACGEQAAAAKRLQPYHFLLPSSRPIQAQPASAVGRGAKRLVQA
ncbi:MAG: hypothetical protein QJR07_16140 [Acetobacteraceae bacterium]|nr:hypothetical protein [Acetobacteraceae bacterium]